MCMYVTIVCLSASPCFWVPTDKQSLLETMYTFFFYIG